MKETTEHPSAEHLEAFVEGALAHRERDRVRIHLMACVHCDSQAEDWRSLFATLRTLPRFAPAPGFATRVMASVDVRRPWQAEARAFLDWLMPRTTWGWAVAVTVFVLPVVAGVTFVAWLLSKSYVTAHGLWVFATDRMAQAARGLAGGLAERAMQSDLANWIAKGVETASLPGPREIGLLAAAGGALTVASAWVLYHYLFRSTHRDSSHVNFCC